MHLHRMTALFSLAILACQGAFAASVPGIDLRPWQMESASSTALPLSGTLVVESPALARGHQTAIEAASGAMDPLRGGSQLRKLLADFSMTLQNIRYRRGGRDPKTGFDCSGFVRYVFRHTAGAELPSDSASQYRAGHAIARGDLKIGDLVFFKTRGKRVSHVGIYLGEGRFIHSPSTGKTVSISHLDEKYWARRYAGAKRPDVLS